MNDERKPWQGHEPGSGRATELLGQILLDSQAREREADELYVMTNLYPASTGLPMTVWVSPRGRARHAARIKVNMAYGPRMTIGNTAVVRLQPVPKLLAGQLSAADRQALFQWIAINEATLLDFWHGRIDGIGLGQRLRPIT
jgi:hypothetical protein